MEPGQLIYKHTSLTNELPCLYEYDPACKPCGIIVNHEHRQYHPNDKFIRIDGVHYTYDTAFILFRVPDPKKRSFLKEPEVEAGSSYRVPLGIRFDLIPPLALRRLAAIYHEGAIKYTENGYLKGTLKASNTISHMLNHLFLWMCGDKKEDHLAKVAWATFTLMVLEEKKPQDIDVRDYGKQLDDESVLITKWIKHNELG